MINRSGDDSADKFVVASSDLLDATNLGSYIKHQGSWLRRHVRQLKLEEGRDYIRDDRVSEDSGRKVGVLFLTTASALHLATYVKTDEASLVCEQLRQDVSRSVLAEAPPIISRGDDLKQFYEKVLHCESLIEELKAEVVAEKPEAKGGYYIKPLEQSEKPDKHKKDEGGLNRINRTSRSLLLRDIWEMLNLSGDYEPWARRALLNFKQGIDWEDFSCAVEIGSTGGQPREDHLVTTEVADKIARETSSSRGNAVRKYLRDTELERNNYTVPVQQLMDAERALEQEQMTLLAVSQELERVQLEVKSLRVLHRTMLVSGQLDTMRQAAGKLSDYLREYVDAEHPAVDQFLLQRWLQMDGYLTEDDLPTDGAKDLDLIREVCQNSGEMMNPTRSNTPFFTKKGLLWLFNTYAPIPDRCAATLTSELREFYALIAS